MDSNGALACDAESYSCKRYQTSSWAKVLSLKAESTRKVYLLVQTNDPIEASEEEVVEGEEAEEAEEAEEIEPPPGGAPEDDTGGAPPSGGSPPGGRRLSG